MSKYMNVDTDDSDIVRAIQTGKTRGMSKDAVSKIVGMPYDVIDRHWHAGEGGGGVVPASPERDDKLAAQRERMAKARAARKPKDG